MFPSVYFPFKTSKSTKNRPLESKPANSVYFGNNKFAMATLENRQANQERATFLI